MNSTICPADLSTLEFELNAIEAKSAKRFKRVALTIPLADSAGELRPKRLAWVQQHIKRTFSKAVALWPMLGGSITYSMQNSGQLSIMAPMPRVHARQRDDLISFKYKLSDKLLLDDENENLNGIFFPVDRTLEAGVPAMLLKITFFDGLLVLGFAFAEVIADNAFIELFLSSMVDSSWDFRRGHGKQCHSARLQLNPIPDSPDQLPFYDQSNKIVLRTPSNQLVSRVVEFQLHAVLGFIRNLRKYHFHCGNNSLDDVKDNDVMAAILWAAITNARRLLGNVQPSDQVKMNILVPGEPMAPTLRHWSYCGNFTVPTVATAPVLGVTDLAADAAPYRNNYYQEYISDCGYGIRWISQAANQIRKAIDDVDEEYVRRVMGAKKGMSAEEDSAAYERCLDRSRTGTTFEDWTGFYRSGCKTTGIPFTDTRQFIRVLPCADDLEEGKIILLSHFKASETAHCQTRRLAWLCLETNTMELVREQLEAGDWIKKESMTDRQRRRNERNTCNEEAPEQKGARE